MDGNYIKVYRSFLDWEWYGNINTKVLFLHMLLKANWKDSKWQGKVIKRGSFVSSIQVLAEETSLTERETRTAILHLKTTGELTSKSTNRYTVFTVTNYDLYQSNDKPVGTQETNNRQSNDNLTTTIEEIKNKRIEEYKKKRITKVIQKEKDEVYYPQDEKLNKAFADYVEMRKAIKKPLATSHAVELAMKNLKELSAVPFSDAMDNDLAIRILEQSIMNSWQGLFALKDNGGGKKTSIMDEWRNA